MSLKLRISYCELQHGQRAPGGQKKRFSDHVKTILKCSIPPDQLETLASDRVAWKDVSEEGLTAFDTNYDQEAEARRQPRKLYLSTKHVDSALFAILKLSQLKAAILFPASKLYSLDTVGAYKI